MARCSGRQRSDLLATRMGLPVARPSISSAFDHMASRSTKANGASRPSNAVSYSSQLRGATDGHYRRVERVPPTGLVLGAVSSVQIGAALAKTLFDDLGPGGTVFLRVVFAAVLLLALWRPRLAGRPRGELLLAAAFGLSLAGMNLSFYEALDRIPLGVAVTFEFVGPLGVAVAGSRRPRGLLWAGLGAGGLPLPSDFGGFGGAASPWGGPWAAAGG